MQNFRSFHLDTPNLLYDDEMANTAQNFATYLASFDKFEHSNTTNGENIAGKYSFLQSAVSDCTCNKYLVFNIKLKK